MSASISRLLKLSATHDEFPIRIPPITHPPFILQSTGHCEYHTWNCICDESALYVVISTEAPENNTTHGVDQHKYIFCTVILAA